MFAAILDIEGAQSRQVLAAQLVIGTLSGHGGMQFRKTLSAVTTRCMNVLSVGLPSLVCVVFFAIGCWRERRG